MTVLLASIIFLTSTASSTRRRARHPGRHHSTVETTDSSPGGGSDADSSRCDIFRTGKTRVLRGELDLSARDLFSRAGDDFVAHCAAELDQLAAAGIPMRMLHPSAQFRRLSAICRLDDVLCMYPADRPAARAGVQT